MYSTEFFVEGLHLDECLLRILSQAIYLFVCIKVGVKSISHNG